jgi:hypothetical protein
VIINRFRTSADNQTAGNHAADTLSTSNPESIVHLSHLSHLSHRTKNDTLNSYLETSTRRTIMATSQTTFTSRVATQRDIDESQELQDRGIRKEFQTMRTYMDKRFELVDERFKEQRAYTDDRFQQVEALMMNSKAASSWHDIVPIRVLNSHAEPPNFPNKVVKFWRLQRPRNQYQLIDLLRFYSIRASDLTTPISDDEEEEESDSSSESQSTLEEAVKAYPTFALARLAARLGLDYGSISHNMGLYEQIQQARAELAEPRVKREQPDDEDKDVARPTKKTVIPEVIQTYTGTGIPIEELIAQPDAFLYKSPTIQSHVSWAPRLGGDSLPSRTSLSPRLKGYSLPSRASPSPSKEDSLPLRASPSSSKKAEDSPPSKDSLPSRVSPSFSKKDSLPSQPSGLSTVPFTPTPSIAKGARKTTSTRTSSKHSQTSEETSV